jgi:hypothetical protein
MATGGGVLALFASGLGVERRSKALISGAGAAHPLTGRNALRKKTAPQGVGALFDIAGSSAAPG